MYLLAVDGRLVIGKAIERRLRFPPVITVAPVIDDAAHIGEAGAVSPRRRFGLDRPACLGETALEVGEDLVGDADTEGFGFYRVVHEGLFNHTPSSEAWAPHWLSKAYRMTKQIGTRLECGGFIDHRLQSSV
jgi:hypothetical protein